MEVFIQGDAVFFETNDVRWYVFVSTVSENEMSDDSNALRPPLPSTFGEWAARASCEECFNKWVELTFGTGKATIDEFSASKRIRILWVKLSSFGNCKGNYTTSFSNGVYSISN